jgi:hypothetical protein
MEKPKLLIILQNFYGFREGKLKCPVYNTSIINRKNATYSRIVPYLEKDFQLYFGECTPQIAKDKDTKFETDLDWVKKALEYHEWFAVLVFSAQAHKAVDDLGFVPFAKLPHPVSFKWRKQTIVDITKQLQDTLLITSQK